jgi:hypothetical protein
VPRPDTPSLCRFALSMRLGTTWYADGSRPELAHIARAHGDAFTGVCLSHFDCTWVWLRVGFALGVVDPHYEWESLNEVYPGM